MAARLMGYVTGISSFADQHLETEAPSHTPKQLQHRYSKTLLTHIRRVEYQLRCFILWLSGILIEKAQNNPDFLTSLFDHPQVTTQAQLAGAVGDELQASTLKNRSLERVLCEPGPGPGSREPSNKPDQTPNLIWKQELELRRLTAKTYPIGGFSVTTPVIETKRLRSRRRIRRLRRDPLELMDAGYLLARMARLPRILKRADLMAERLARRALLSSQNHENERHHDPHLGPPLFKGRRRDPTDQRNTIGLTLPLEKGELEGDHPFKLVSAFMAKHTPPNPLFFEPFRRWMPPDALWQSTEDEDERGDMSWLHYVASDTLSRTGFSPGPDPGSRLPDLSRFEPPSLPQIRAT